MPEPRRIRDARRECEEYGAFREVVMRGPGRRAHRATRVRALCPMRRTARSTPLPTRPHGAIVSGHMISRRAFLGGVAFLAAPLRAAGQKAARQPTIGVLSATRLTAAVQGAIRDGLREQGYVEGRNLVIEWRAAEGRTDRAAALAAELARLKVDVIVALLTPAVQAAKNATSTIPIVMAPAGDPVGSGFVVSLARPGRNITGVTGISAELSGKQLEALRQLVPKLTRLALLVNPADPFSKSLIEYTQAAAKTVGVEVHVVIARNAEELERAFATMAEHQDEGVLVQAIFT